MKKLRHIAFLIFAMGAAFEASQAGDLLREQLKLAEEKNDAHAQVEIVRRLLDREPADSQLQERLVYLWLDVLDYDMAERALKDWKEASEQAKASVTAKILRNRDDNTAGAIAVLETYRRKNPTDIEITRQLAGYLSPQEQVKLLNEAPGVDKDAGLLVQRAIAKRTLQDFPGALGDFALAMKVGPQNMAVSGNQAAFERLAKALPKIQAATETLKGNGQDLGALLQRAYWYLWVGFATELALPDAEAAVKISPDSPAARILYARSLGNLGRLSFEEVLKKYAVDTGKDIPPSQNFDRLAALDLKLLADPSDRKALAARCFELNDAPQQYRLALKDADALIALDAKNAGARVEKIYALTKIDRYADAAAEYQALEASRPSRVMRARAAGYLADADFAARRFDRAFDYQSEAIKENPSAENYKRRAATLQRLNRQAEADADLAKAKQLEKGRAR